MLRLRTSTLAHLLSTSERLLSATATPCISANPSSFAIGDYLVETCGLTRAQADKASAKVSHLKSPSKPEAVVAFLAGLGVSSTEVAPLVARDPEFLCARVDRTLAPNVADLTGLGLSRAEIARLASLGPRKIPQQIHRPQAARATTCPSLGAATTSSERSSVAPTFSVLYNLEQVVMPIVVFLRRCGLSDCDIAKLCIHVPRMLTGKPERVQEMAVHAEGLGVPRGSGMFREALQAVAFLGKEKITAIVDYLKKTFRWSHARVSGILFTDVHVSIDISLGARDRNVAGPASSPVPDRNVAPGSARRVAVCHLLRACAPRRAGRSSFPPGIAPRRSREGRKGKEGIRDARVHH
ncbi:hypothetical protein QYE76_019469 [Lolium multiflorum]|uniref:Uncharacterized protein n=1 Tax=Lolium multiflorum TaxID=4521 RepID=A0AAD8VN59_LOLMU|nr:hypothetical protein QYE76_019469 [Lolium multiflorum]